MTLSLKKSRCNFKKRQRKKKKLARKLNRLKQKERTSKKKNNRLKKERRRIRNLSQKMEQFIGTEEIESLARSTKFLTRNSKILPLAFVITLAYGLFGDGSKSLSLLSSNMYSWFGIQVTAQALSDRLKQKSTLNLLKKVFVKVLNFQLSNGFKSKYASLFKYFKAVKIEDSTTFELDERNKKAFKGTGGAASASAMKLDCCYNLSNHVVANVEISSGIKSDQKFANKILKTMEKGELLIRDLGYFNLISIQIMITSGIYFLSRLQKGMLLFLSKDKSVEIDKFLQEHTKDGQTIDRDVFISQEKIPVRMIALKVPEEVKKQRIERFKKVRKKAPTEDYICWCGYSIFITNIPREFFAASVILEIYKIRWQIELFFKSIKQTLKIHVIRTKCVNSTKCMIYAKLISLMMASLIISYAENVCESKEEISFDKAIKWLHNDNRFGIAIAKKELKELLETMIEELSLICKDSRIKKTSTYRCLKRCFEDKKAA